jgi:hypothetical protein
MNTTNLPKINFVLVRTEGKKKEALVTVPYTPYIRPGSTMAPWEITDPTGQFLNNEAKEYFAAQGYPVYGAYVDRKKLYDWVVEVYFEGVS